MKPGDMVKIRRFDEMPFLGIYLGPSNRFDDGRKKWEGRFLLNTGIIKDIDLENLLIWNLQVLE